MSPIVVLVALATGVIGAVIGNPKGHPVWGFFLGFMLSVIGIIVIACVKPNEEVLAKRRAVELAVEEKARRMAGYGPPPPAQQWAPPPSPQWSPPQVQEPAGPAGTWRQGKHAQDDGPGR